MQSLVHHDNSPLRFIHIPKTGGTSVISWLMQNGIDVLWGGALKGNNHLPTKKHAPASYWYSEPTRKFAVVRHPATRLVSFFRYVKQNFAEYQDCTFTEFLQHRLQPTSGKKIISPWQDQCHWLMRNDRIIVDHVLRLENLQQDLSRLFGVSADVPKINTTSHAEENLMAWYTNKDLARVKKAFARDFQMLGYIT